MAIVQPYKSAFLLTIALVSCLLVLFRILVSIDLNYTAQLISNVATKLPGHRANPDITRNIVSVVSIISPLAWPVAWQHQLIESRRFVSEPHFITTSDGYILQTIRIVNPLLKDRSQLKPILMFHGFQCSGSLWIVTSNGTLGTDGHYYEYDENQKVINGSATVGNTLGFVLASKKYDVWLANYRGSIYSSNHTTFTTEGKLQHVLPA